MCRARKRISYNDDVTTTTDEIDSTETSNRGHIFLNEHRNRNGVSRASVNVSVRSLASKFRLGWASKRPEFQRSGRWIYSSVYSLATFGRSRSRSRSTRNWDKVRREGRNLGTGNIDGRGTTFKSKREGDGNTTSSDRTYENRNKRLAERKIFVALPLPPDVRRKCVLPIEKTVLPAGPFNSNRFSSTVGSFLSFTLCWNIREEERRLERNGKNRWARTFLVNAFANPFRAAEAIHRLGITRKMEFSIDAFR